LISEKLTSYHHLGQLITIEPTENGGDIKIDRNILEQAKLKNGINSLIIRTLPNSKEKKTKMYSGTNPPYFTEQAMDYIVDHGVDHLVTDLPSIDKEKDAGKLLAHKSFWNTKGAIREKATITELAFIPEIIIDGFYLLNLQVLSLEMDVSPSNPNLYSLNTI
jgi:kynurenine formamidase